MNDKLVVHLAGIRDERGLIRKDMPEKHTIRVHVRGEIVWLRLGHFRGHVTDGAGESSEVVGPILVPFAVLQLLGKAHVKDFDLSADVESNVVGFNISVDDTVIIIVVRRRNARKGKHKLIW